MRYNRNLVVTSAAMVIAAGMPAIAKAQTAEQDAEESGVREIVVTAQRRSESIQKASLSIAAVDSKVLQEQGITGPQGLNNIVPGLKLAVTNGLVQTFVRGVGDITSNAYSQASVSLNVDGVYMARSNAFAPTFFDVARVEVLRGPQGTLYGRNSSGGAINIITNAPKLGSISGYLALEGGNYGLVRGQAAVNIPLGDTLAIRAATQVTDRDGYLSDGANDDESGAGRLRLLWQPSDTVTVNLTGEYARIGGFGSTRPFRPALFGDPWTGPNDPRITTALYPALRYRRPVSLDVEYYGFSGQLDWDLGFATLTVVPSYRHTDTDAKSTADLTYEERNISGQTSLEVRMAGNTGPVKWVVGGFAFEEQLSVNVFTTQQIIANNSGQFGTQVVPDFDTKAKALFGEVSVSVADRFRLIGGLRYTSESLLRNAVLTSATANSSGVPGTPAVITITNQKKSSNAVTWRAGVEADVGAQSMLFATVSKGFKSGGFNAADADGFDPEFVTAYTVGLKNRLFNNTLQLNLEGFYWKYRDQQVSFLGLTSGGLPSFLTKNAGRSTIYGMSVDLNWRPTENDALSVGAEYLHTKFDDFRYKSIAFPAALPAGPLPDGCASDGPTGVPLEYIQNCTGKPLPRTPKWTANARYAHDFRMANGAKVTFGGTAKYESRYYIGFNYLSPNFQQKAYGLFDADLTYSAPGGMWTVQAYIRNITNKAVYQQASNEGSIPPTSGVNRGSVAVIGAPRTFGARFQYNF